MPLVAQMHLAPPSTVTTYSEDFENAVSLDLWRPNTIAHPDGTPAFDVTQENGVLKNIVNQVNFYDGQFLNFTKNENIIFDISGNPYLAFDVKVEPGATYDGIAVDTVPFLVSPWGPNEDGVLQREFLAQRMDVPADGQWHTLTYDITVNAGLPDFDGSILENDLSEIEAILLENVIWPSTYAFSMEMDNFKVGEAAFTVSVKDLAPGLEFNAYPNPVNYVLTVTCDESIEEIVIYDIQGRLLLSKKVYNSNELNIDVSTFESGLFLLQVNSASRTNTQLINKK